MSRVIAFVNDWSISHEAAENLEGATDVVFFKVKAKVGANPQELKDILTSECKVFTNNALNLFDGAEHGYIDLGDWLGSQALALTVMGLGDQLGLWKVVTPQSKAGISNQSDEGQYLAREGYVLIQAQTVSN
ncbi:hypothetical protein RYA05_00545 [Pseudomonas syringae pv. actinidiae]|nr:hypothetical protein [Pseudomonas syringae pv. actinidiae]